MRKSILLLSLAVITSMVVTDFASAGMINYNRLKRRKGGPAAKAPAATRTTQPAQPTVAAPAATTATTNAVQQPTAKPVYKW